jgi:hypothetical protein
MVEESKAITRCKHEKHTCPACNRKRSATGGVATGRPLGLLMVWLMDADKWSRTEYHGDLGTYTEADRKRGREALRRVPGHEALMREELGGMNPTDRPDETPGDWSLHLSTTSCLQS